MASSLTPEQEKAVDLLVEAGLYASRAAALAHYSLEGLQEDARKLAV